MRPPPLPGQKNLRLAQMWNVFLPGAGLFYLGRRLSGGILAAGFLVCFIGTAGVFLAGYINYLNIALGEDLLKEGKLEEVGAAFHQNWLLAFLGAGFTFYLISSILFWNAKRQAKGA